MGESPAGPQGAEDEGAPAPRSRRRRALVALGGALRGLSIRQGLLGLFLLALVVSIPFGGMRAASVPPPTTFTVGESFHAAPFDVTVTGARHGQDIGVAAVPATDGRYLVVVATVSTTEKTSVPRRDGLSEALQDLVRLADVPGLERNQFDTRVAVDSLDAEPVSILVFDDGQEMGAVAPHLAYKLAFFFRQAPGQGSPPSSIKVVLRSHTFRANTFDGTEQWLDPTTAAEADVRATPFTEDTGSTGGAS